MQYTTVDRILAKLHRELKTTVLNEVDIINYIAEALGFLKVYKTLEESVAFLKVENFETEVPRCFNTVLQIARNRKWTDYPEEEIINSIVDTAEEESVTLTCPPTEDGIPLDCQGKLPDNTEYTYYRPFFDLQWEYSLWTRSSLYNRDYTPVLLSDHTFFNSLVAQERHYDNLYASITDEYTIVGTTDRKFRFSFKDGFVAVSYLKVPVDDATGYPLVPDQISFITAITYYTKWKIAENLVWAGREGYATLAKESQSLWLKYARQAKSWAKMPKTLDEHQFLLKQTHQIVPNLNKYNRFFSRIK